MSVEDDYFTLLLCGIPLDEIPLILERERQQNAAGRGHTLPALAHPESVTGDVGPATHEPLEYPT